MVAEARDHSLHADPRQHPQKEQPLLRPERFTYLPESNSYRCPAGQPLNYGGRNARNHTYAYIGTRKRCGSCLLKAQCTGGAFRYLAIHMHEPARQRARELATTPEFANAQRERKKVEALFAELKKPDRTASPAQFCSESAGALGDLFGPYRLLSPSSRQAALSLLLLCLHLFASRRLVFLYDLGGNLIKDTQEGLALHKREHAISVQTKKLVSFLIWFSSLLIYFQGPADCQH